MRIVKGNHRSLAGGLVKQVENSFRKIVGLDGTTRHADNRNARLGFPVPTQIVENSHGASGISLHGVDTAVSSASAGDQYQQCLSCDKIDSLARGHWLTGLGSI